MAPSSPNSQCIAFDRVEAELLSGELRKDGRRVRLQAQPFQLLALLLEHPGEVVTREAVCRNLWKTDTFVDFDHSLGTAINKIREALSDSAENPRFIETLPRRGYRFIGKIAGSDGAQSSEISPAARDANVALGTASADKGIEAGSAPAVHGSRQSRRLRFALALAASF